ncbi:hypothetical protein BACCIP111895_04602 [Neobacillus rhizosphaerae]|uniref:Uncharacterized protein n=1 Tax=Neobacillus rhizosphaerae TaxID=2880965 RepID=A0ABM9EZ00_9BACI|nr:hypothetical protein BACCIP111895_04602 [Neobacillus rhizosphaerae]
MKNALLIGVEGAKTPAGVRDRGDPAGAGSAEEAHRTARGKRSAWNGNQLTSLMQQNKKKLSLNPKFFEFVDSLNSTFL